MSSLWVKKMQKNVRLPWDQVRQREYCATEQSLVLLVAVGNPNKETRKVWLRAQTKAKNHHTLPMADHTYMYPSFVFLATEDPRYYPHRVCIREEQKIKFK